MGGTGCRSRNNRIEPQTMAYNLTEENCWIPGSPDGRFKPTPGAFNVPEILFAHGYADPSCDVYRYWEMGLPISISGAPYVYPLLVRCPISSGWPQRGPGRVLAIFSSFTPVASAGDHVIVQLNQTALGLRRGARATDAITRENVNISADGTLSFWLNAHDFRLIAVK